MKILLTFFSFWVFLGCETSHFPDRFYSIQIENNSDDTIEYYFGNYNEGFFYPDTSLEIIPPKMVRINPRKSS